MIHLLIAQVNDIDLWISKIYHWPQVAGIFQEAMYILRISHFLVVFALLVVMITTGSCSPGGTGDTGQTPVTWQQTYGTRFSDYSSEIIETSDGGFLLTGYTESTASLSVASLKNRGGALLIKLNGKGIMEWVYIHDKYPQSDGDGVVQIQNGHFVTTGFTITGSRATGFDMDVFLQEVDEEGSPVWENVIQGPLFEAGSRIVQVDDGGYVIAGLSSKYNAEENAYQNEDFYLLKTDSNGQPIWHQTYGTDKEEALHSIDKTNDGGYILVGVHAEESYIEENEYWRLYGKGAYVVKTDSQGNEQWSQVYGEDIQGYGYSVQQTNDGGFIVAGTSVVRGGKQSDVYMLKLDAHGNEEWSQRHGGLEEEVARCIRQTDDGGYIIVGYSESFGAGDEDLILLKTDISGAIEWTQIYGGSEADRGASVRQTQDGGYIIVGSTKSFGKGDYEVWVIKTDSLGEVNDSR
jgi:hypothetical protein